MEHFIIDSDASSQSTVGTGQVEAVFRSLQDARPNWVSDGFGIRGPQEPRQREPNATPFPMEFGVPAGGRASDAGGSSGTCAPGNSAIPSSGTWVWGVVDGDCQWIDTTDCPPPE